MEPEVIETVENVGSSEPTQMAFDYANFAHMLGKQKSQWSKKRWMLVKGEEGLRLMPIDLTRYTGELLREVRARKTNFKGEIQR